MHNLVRSTVSECSSLSGADDDRIEPTLFRRNTACSILKVGIVPTEIETIDVESPERVDNSGEVVLPTFMGASVSNDATIIEDDRDDNDNKNDNHSDRNSDSDSVIVFTSRVQMSVTPAPTKRPRNISHIDNADADPLSLPGNCHVEHDDSQSQTN